MVIIIFNNLLASLATIEYKLSMEIKRGRVWLKREFCQFVVVSSVTIKKTLFSCIVEVLVDESILLNETSSTSPLKINIQ